MNAQKNEGNAAGGKVGTSDSTERGWGENRPSQDSLIAQVLEATLAGGNTSLNEAEWESLAQVARAHPPGTPLQLALVCQLVSSLLNTRFPKLADEKAMFHQMSLRIGGSLWTHPRSQQHLNRFWELLSSDVRK